MSDFQKEPFIDLAGGRIRCRRYQAMSIRREHSETVAYLRELEDVAWHDDGDKNTRAKTKKLSTG